MPVLIQECDPQLSGKRSDGIKEVLGLINNAEVVQARRDFANKPELIVDAQNRQNSVSEKQSRRAARICQLEQRSIANLQGQYDGAKGTLINAWNSTWAKAIEHGLDGEELVWVDAMRPRLSDSGEVLGLLESERGDARLQRYQRMVRGTRLLLYHAIGGELWIPDDNPRQVFARNGGVLAAKPEANLSRYTPSPTALVEIQFEGEELFSASLHQPVAIGGKEIDRLMSVWTAEHRAAFDDGQPPAGALPMVADVFTRVGVEFDAELLAS